MPATLRQFGEPTDPVREVLHLGAAVGRTPAPSLQVHDDERSRSAGRDRQFYAQAPDQRWVGDTTELLIGAGGTKLYFAEILDLFSRFVVGWATSAVNDRHLTIEALDMALRRRCPGDGLLHHSDQGGTPQPRAEAERCRVISLRSDST